ncbi:hypothetical protein BDW62DRAFT_201774 [Aspergillus aurantiobrunneus]
MDSPSQSKEIAPASTGWTVEYTMDVDLECKKGSDVPLYNKNLKYYYGDDERMILHEQNGPKSEWFDAKKEDYWLFHIHSHSAEFEIAIGGETPVLVNSKPSWKKYTDKEGDFIYTSYMQEDPLGNQHELFFKSSYVFEGEAKGAFDRFLAVRCPKMDNPAITIKGSGHFACLHWVGLFIKSTKDNTNKFITVRTTNRLLPEYGQRNRDAGYDWFEEDGAADITGRTVTLFPKQLYGTNGSDPELYDKYVTTDPDNSLGQKHFELVHAMVEQKASLLAYKYTWNATGDTFITTSRDDDAIFPIDKINYVTGLTVKKQTLNGWTVLFAVFTSVTQVTAGLLTTNFGSIVAGILGMVDVFDEDKMKKEADWRGFVTAAAKAVDEYNKKFPGDKKKKPNTADVPTIKFEIDNKTILNMHFGTSSQGDQAKTINASGVDTGRASSGLPEGWKVVN